VCDVIDSSKTGEPARIKWPNDVVFVRPPDAPGESLAKLAGILAEGRPQEGWAVLGVGLNVAVRLEELSAELRGTAATLGESPAAIEPTLARLLATLERRLAEPTEALLEAYRARDALRGREIEWGPHGTGRVGHGRAEGIDGEGRLVVALPGGGHTTLDAGEVHLRPV
jgi:BirA family biotin operon repressor/biotin-[acetyl-CoA-carboxylase] ligase